MAGVFDVATDWGYPDHDADFGLTLAIGRPQWGLFVVPLIGPSGLRDLTGYGVDVAGDPFIWIGQGTAVEALRWSRVGIEGIDERERLEFDDREHQEGLARSVCRVPQCVPAVAAGEGAGDTRR